MVYTWIRFVVSLFDVFFSALGSNHATLRGLSNDLLLQSKADGLMMIARDKGWLRDLLRKHTTDEMVFMGRYPVLVVPERLDISENLSVSGPSGQ